LNFSPITNSMMQKIFFILFLFLNFTAYPQLEFSGEVNMKGMYSTGENLPFWMYKNQRGRISENTNAAGWITGKAIYDLSYTSTLEVGAGILYRDGNSDRVFLDESYMQFRNTWLEVVAGRKQKPELYKGISSTNENILWSLNARPLPGIQIRTRKPLFIFPEAGIGFEASLEEYLFENGRVTKNARLHHKSLHLVYRPSPDLQFKAGIQHFVQWGGTSEEFGPQPQGFNDYLKIFAGRGGGEGALQGDQENVLGNHLGSWELYVDKDFRDYRLGLIYNNIFEDGSGSRFANFPDGRYGIYFENKEKDRLVNAVIYEFFYTRHQSNNVNRWGADNYLGHGVYSPGWTYEDRILGAPFFTYDEQAGMIVNNKFTVHHLGLSGQVSNYWNVYPYKLLLTYAHNEGTFRRGLPFGNENALHVFGELRLLNRPFNLEIELASTFNSKKEPIFSAGISIHKSF